MKKILVLFAMFFGVFNAYANIALTPFYLEFDTETNQRKETVRFTNTSNKTADYKIEFVNFAQGTDGKYKNATTENENLKFADKYLEYSPHIATLKPMESQVVRVQRRGMTAAADGEYISHLLIQEQETKVSDKTLKDKKNVSISLEPLYGVSIPVILRKGALTATAKIETYKPGTSDGGASTADIKVSRTGTKSFYGSLVVKENGNEIGKVSKFRIFLDANERLIKVPITSKPKKQIEILLIDETTNEIISSKII